MTGCALGHRLHRLRNVCMYQNYMLYSYKLKECTYVSELYVILIQINLPECEDGTKEKSEDVKLEPTGSPPVFSVITS